MVHDLKKPGILLVEDSEDDAYFFTRTFEKSGISCALQHVSNGAAAIDLLKKRLESDVDSLPKVMFLDLKMPVLNGFEVLTWIRKDTLLSEIRVVVLSGSDQPNDKQRARDLGASGYMVKPVKIDDLREYLRDICPHSSVSPVAVPGGFH